MLKNRTSSESGELGEILRSFRQVFFSVAAFSFVINLLMLTPAVYMLQVYDRVLTGRNETTLLMLTFLVVGLFALLSLFEWVRARILVRAGAAFDMRLNNRVFDAAFQHYLHLKGGNAQQAFSDLTNVRQFITGNGLFAFLDAPWAPIYIIVIALLHPWLGLFALLAALLLLGLALLNERLTSPILSEAQQWSGRANNYAGSNLRNAEVIEGMGMLPALRQRWFERQAKFLSLQSKASDEAGWVSGTTKFVRITAQSLILGLGALLVLENEVTAGAMIASSILLGRALAPVELAISTWRQFVVARGAYGRLNELLGRFPPPPERLSLPAPKGNISVENLFVAAPGQQAAILKGLNFQIQAGSAVAVIGPSASGKSTLARALVGVWPALAGCVRLDGADIAKWNREELGPHIGYLPQDVELFDGTIAENIARFSEIESEKVIDAARRAGVHEMILRFPNGYDTPIGEGGAALSGGQRQRIALARALYGNPVLLVLDEPNSNLDDAGEQALVAALHGMKAEGRTVFLITHRLSVIKEVDAILVLREGAIQTIGPRDQVLAALSQQAQASVPSKSGYGT
jgi:ATP-binding cassette subfamily C exporter for protease/lipase